MSTANINLLFTDGSTAADPADMRAGRINLVMGLVLDETNTNSQIRK